MRRLAYLTVLILLLSGGGWLGLGKLERQAIYQFDATRVAPVEAGLASVQEIEAAIDGETLIIWMKPPKSGKPTILYFHGNAGNLASRAGRFSRFTQRGYGLIAPAYRGSSGSSGKPSERGLSRDARWIYARLDQLIPGLSTEKVVIYGESLGTGVAMKLVADRRSMQPAAVVLEAPYTSLPDVVRHTYPELEPLIPRMTNIWNSLEHVRGLTAPLLVLHGDADRMIPSGQGRQVFAAAPSNVKRFLVVKGADHNETWRTDTLPVLWYFIDAYATSIR